MTVAELIENLKSCDEDLEVVFSYNSGDYWRTTVAQPIRDISEDYCEWSDYHEKLRLNDEAEKMYLVLS